MKGHCLATFLCGAAVGALVALLTAPDSGSNTRHKISDKFKKGEQKIKDTIEEGMQMIPENK